MFYSHQILTSREGGLATVWLVATLGSKHNLKRVNRKAILDVNIPKTCRIIIHPEAPMALRLQSNLLYGVSRVFLQQSGYALSDAQVAQANMNALLKAVRTSALDPSAGKARPDQLIVEDDPAFLPDVALPGLDFDLSALDLSTEGSSRRSTILSPHSQRSSLSSQHADGSMLELVIPSSVSGGIGDFGGFQLPSEQPSSAQRNERLGRLLEDDGEGFDIDPGFSIDAEGNLIEEAVDRDNIQPGVSRPGSDSGASARARQAMGLDVAQGHEGAPMIDLDFEMPRFNDDGAILPNAEPFPAMAEGPAAGKLRSSSQARENEESSESAQAPVRRRRPRPRTMPFDQRMELHNSDLASWKQEYLANMATASVAKRNHHAAFAAKRNAAKWVTGLGIGGVGAGIGSKQTASPLDMFTGDGMMQMLTGIDLNARRKRALSADSDGHTGSEARRRRLRDSDEEEIGRGDNLMLGDDDLGFANIDDIEVGRHAPTPLGDDPTFPWNTTASAIASRHGPSIARGPGVGSVGGFPSSVGGAPSLQGPQSGSLDRRGNQITSASPFTGRGATRYSSLEVPAGQRDELQAAAEPPSDDYQGFGDEYDSFQFHGPGAGVATQTVGQTQWMESTLDREAKNFLEFVRAELANLRPPTPRAERNVEEEEDELASSPPAPPKRLIEFEQLLPPGQHTTIVAAQALHHILALATDKLMTVQQDEPFGPIRLDVPPSENLTQSLNA